jgi:hypothetical protein
LATVGFWREVGQTWSFRGSKSRNKVSVGEPAEGSLPKDNLSILKDLFHCAGFDCIVILGLKHGVKPALKTLYQPYKNWLNNYNNW